MKIKVVNKSDLPLPSYEMSRSAGIDLQAYISSLAQLKPLSHAFPAG